jgi:hypothetical protein
MDDDIEDLMKMAFEDSKPLEVKEDNASLRGKKRCKSCNAIVGARTKVCSCGLDFSDVPSTKVQKAIEKAAEDSELDDSVFDYIKGLGISGKRFLTVYTPAGKCPVTLNGYTYEDIKMFCEEVVDFGIQQRPSKLYLPSAVKYWLLKTASEKKQEETLKLFNEWLRNNNENACG